MMDRVERSALAGRAAAACLVVGMLAAPLQALQVQSGAAGDHASPNPPLAVGETVPTFDAEKVDGGKARVAYAPGRTTVLLFFLSSCPHCQRTIPLWNAAYARKAKNVDVLGVMLDHEFPGFFNIVPVSFPVLRAPDREVLKAFKVNTVPVTLRVAPGGKVQDVQVGPADPIRLGELFRP